MPSLTLKYKENVIKKYPIKEGVSLTIGRRNTNTVVIENLAVSGNHAKIENVGDAFLFSDMQSKNGSFINKQLVSSHYLNHGDTITIGKHSLIFTYNENEARPDNTFSNVDQTMVIDTEQHRSMLTNTSSDAPQKEPTGIITFLKGGNEDIQLSKKLTKIGKDLLSDIVIKGLMVGKTAATISMRPNGYYLSYVGGMAKPKVNGEIVKTTIKLNEFDEIMIGSVKMQFLHKN